MSVSVELIPCHPDEPAWSAIDRVCGRGTAHNLDEDDPDAPTPLHEEPPPRWRHRFLAAIRPLADWDVSDAAGATSLSTDRWRWHIFVGNDAVTLTYRRTGPAGAHDFEDRLVLSVAADLGMIAYWPDLLTWADLRTEPTPDMLG